MEKKKCNWTRKDGWWIISWSYLDTADLSKWHLKGYYLINNITNTCSSLWHFYGANIIKKHNVALTMNLTLVSWYEWIRTFFCILHSPNLLNVFCLYESRNWGRTNNHLLIFRMLAWIYVYSIKHHNLETFKIFTSIV